MMDEHFDLIRIFSKPRCLCMIASEQMLCVQLLDIHLHTLMLHGSSQYKAHSNEFLQELNGNRNGINTSCYSLSDETLHNQWVDFYSIYLFIYLFGARPTALPTAYAQVHVCTAYFSQDGIEYQGQFGCRQFR